jgi:hypothetical protein
MEDNPMKMMRRRPTAAEMDRMLRETNQLKAETLAGEVPPEVAQRLTRPNREARRLHRALKRRGKDG